jgi:hypothetical protein
VKQIDLDINSGDLRNRVYVCYLPVRSKITESTLSHEVRRLSVAVPANRVWRPAFVQRREPTHSDYLYGRLVSGVFDQLVTLLDETHTPDEERRVILDQFMKSLRLRHALDAQEEGYTLMASVADKHGLHIFDPEFLKQLKRE